MLRVRVFAAVFAAVALAFAPAVRAQSDETADLRKEVQELKELVKAQNARIEALEKRNATPLAVAPAKDAAPAPAGKPLPKGAVGAEAYWKDGFNLRTTDDKAVVHFGGSEVYHGRFFTSESRNPSTFYNRLARLKAEGRLFTDWDFRLEGDFVGGAVDLQDGWVGFEHFQEANLRVGQFKEPFSMEELTPDPFIKFAERSPLDRIAPSRDLGAQLYGKLFGERLEYAVAIFNGAGKKNNPDGDNNNDKDVAWRLVVRPFVDSESAWLKGLYLSGGGTWGNEEGAFADIATIDSGTVWLDAHPSAANAGSTRREGTRQRWSGELAWLVGPFGLRAEYSADQSDLERSNGAGATATSPVESTLDLGGWYVQGTYWLTGEDETYQKRPTVTHVFAPWSKDGGWGALELAVRYTTLHVDQDIFDAGLASRAVSSSGVDQWAGGVNWWFNPNVRFTTDFFHNHFDGGITIDGDRESDESLIMTRMQLDF